MSLRMYEMCSGRCPPDAPCTEEMSINFRKVCDSTPGKVDLVPLSPKEASRLRRANKPRIQKGVKLHDD
jgi:hypothetical protein